MPHSKPCVTPFDQFTAALVRARHAEHPSWIQRRFNLGIVNFATRARHPLRRTRVRVQDIVSYARLCRQVKGAPSSPRLRLASGLRKSVNSPNSCGCCRERSEADFRTDQGCPWRFEGPWSIARCGKTREQEPHGRRPRKMLPNRLSASPFLLPDAVASQAVASVSLIPVIRRRYFPWLAITPGIFSPIFSGEPHGEQCGPRARSDLVEASAGM
jgi:hypothetical protein